MAAVVPSSPAPAAPTTFEFNLSTEARLFLRQRFGILVVGVGLGSVFVGLGIYELALYLSSFAPVDTVVAALLIVLGATLIVLSLRSGLLNPVTGLRGDDQGLSFERRWRGVVTWAWSDPRFDLEVEDLSPDPASSPAEKEHMFFSGRGPVYGNLTPAFLGPLLDVARARGLAVRMSMGEVRTGRTYHQIRRIRIGRFRTR